jgi:hypothetical protein
VDPHPLYGSRFNPVVFDGLVAGLSDEAILEQELGTTPPWLADQYFAATAELRQEFPTIAARFKEGGGSAIWLDEPTATETAILWYAVLRHVAESCEHFSDQAAGPYTVLLDYGYLACFPCADRRVETHTVDDEAMCRFCDEVPDQYVAVAIGFPGTLFIADICIKCRDKLVNRG